MLYSNKAYYTILNEIVYSNQETGKLQINGNNENGNCYNADKNIKNQSQDFYFNVIILLPAIAIGSFYKCFIRSMLKL